MLSVSVKGASGHSIRSCSESPFRSNAPWVQAVAAVTGSVKRTEIVRWATRATFCNRGATVSDSTTGVTYRSSNQWSEPLEDVCLTQMRKKPSSEVSISSVGEPITATSPSHALQAPE